MDVGEGEHLLAHTHDFGVFRRAQRAHTHPNRPVAAVFADDECVSDEKFFGVYPAVVVGNLDPFQRGRVQIETPGIAGSSRTWATVVGRGTDPQDVPPAVGTEVVVAFGAGDQDRPYGLGAVSTGGVAQAPSEAQTLSLGGGHQLVIDQSAHEVRLRHSNGTSVVLGSGGSITITANSTVEITAPALTVHAPIATFDGVISCATMVASAGVVSPSYTPGVGNLE